MREKTSVPPRVEKAINAFKKEGIDSLLVTNSANVRYLSGFNGAPNSLLGYKNDDARLLITKKKSFLVTDPRYELQAKKDVKGFEVRIRHGSLPQAVAGLAGEAGVRRLGFEAGDISFELFDGLKRSLRGVELMPVFDLVESFRRIKDAGETALIKHSVRMLKKAVNYFESILRPGLTEKDLSARMEYFIMAESGERSSFDMVVASGPNSALPHAKPEDRPIKPNDMVLLDLGVNYEGYNSDLTRVFFLGKIKSGTKKIYEIVKEANKRSIKAIRPGVEISKIDQIARGFIRKRGFGRYFGHALGHGIGLEVHESPSISGKNHAVLRPGMIFTIEPAIYLPGRCGIRIEDMVLVTKKGCEVLTDGINK